MIQSINENFKPLMVINRGNNFESLHFGAIAIADKYGNSIAWYGDPHQHTFLRSSAKPIQAIPLIERNGHTYFKLTQAEIAITCASHTGTYEHAETVQSILGKIGLGAGALKCGVHPPIDKSTEYDFVCKDEPLSPLHHNCSGKHAGMLAHAVLRGLDIGTYLDIDHPVQRTVLQTFSEMTDVPVDDIRLGTDGCSLPNFSIPLHNTAASFARICDPSELESQRAFACRTITQAMIAHPRMVSGPGRSDTRLIQAGNGRLIAKGGAEGYQAVGMMPDALWDGSPALGIAIKVSDGDAHGRARPAVVLEVLRQLGGFEDAFFEGLNDLGPSFLVRNYRDLDVGEGRPVFELNFSEGWKR